MDRKEFLKSAGCMCGAGVIAGMLLTAESCAPKKQLYKATVSAGKALIPLGLFENGNVQVVNVQGLEEKVGVVKKTDGTFNAFEMKCTHAGATLKPVEGQFYCNLHGSKFDDEGNVVKGPAKTALKKFKTSMNAEYLEIHIG